MATSSDGAVTYVPVPGASGTATITDTVTANRGTANGRLNTTTRSVAVLVTPVNQAPTIDAITNPSTGNNTFTVLEGTTATQSVSLTGIGPGPGASDAGQIVSVNATSSNPNLVPNPS